MRERFTRITWTLKIRGVSTLICKRDSWVELLRHYKSEMNWQVCLSPRKICSNVFHVNKLEILAMPQMPTRFAKVAFKAKIQSYVSSRLWSRGKGNSESESPYRCSASHFGNNDNSKTTKGKIAAMAINRGALTTAERSVSTRESCNENGENNYARKVFASESNLNQLKEHDLLAWKEEEEKEKLRWGQKKRRREREKHWTPRLGF